MSVKLKAAMLANKVSVQSKQAGEALVWYRDRDGKRATELISPFATVELAPRLTDAKLLIHSNLDDLVAQRAIRIVAG